jgi:hypothetical protein
MNRLLRRRRREKDVELFYTHTGAYYGPGRRELKDDAWYVVTRVKRTSDTILYDSSRAPCWIVYGRPA